MLFIGSINILPLVEGVTVDVHKGSMFYIILNAPRRVVLWRVILWRAVLRGWYCGMWYILAIPPSALVGGLRKVEKNTTSTFTNAIAELSKKFA